MQISGYTAAGTPQLRPRWRSIISFKISDLFSLKVLQCETYILYLRINIYRQATKQPKIMTVHQAKEKLRLVKNLEHFQELFFSEDFDSINSMPRMTPDFKLVYKSGMGGYTTNPAAATYSKFGCSNSYMELEDGFIEYPF